MPNTHATDEADLRRCIDTLIAAIRAMDLEGIAALYAPDIVSFDIVPPLRHLGADAKRKNWADAFAEYRAPLDYDVRDLEIVAGDDIAFAYSFNRLSGTLKNGGAGAAWVRWTACFRKVDGRWRIAHDHVSVPLDMRDDRGLLDLEP